jgi:hypothetical protein
MTVRPVPKEAKMNKAAGLQEKSGHEKPAHAASVGQERKADLKGAQLGEPTDKMPIGPGHTHLSGATKELKEQHPIHYSDHGPHHGTDHHKRHKPLHGMKPSGSY